MEIFETHVHFTSREFSAYYERLISLEANFLYLNVATSLSESKEVIEQAKKFEKLYCAIGIHPLYLSEVNKEMKEVINQLEEIIQRNKGKVLAIGEIGLDFYRVTKEESYEQQIKWLDAQLQLARKYNLSSVLHIRNAMTEAIEFLKQQPSFYGIIHSFYGTKENLRELLELSKDCFISFSPLIFRDIERFRELISETPIDRLLVESDSPYLALGPTICRSILRVISEVKKIELSELKKIVLDNSKRALKLLK
ncbi:hydrolase, TatD family protein [Mycoplasma wenyonii str. Massachusetts]|uniref:Hydrolase, TatD family protein n=1 Tax=Mycoplasma wenyonii (strain Massachusetts) TaxID=1197325 RepID=I6YAB5_MYCWM|nr:TatD family hydrolase [Mycoplasma wenyonii]AFN64886.1 hydrolase, TatD family protein [Mycoplasma wenyonii str. Massachusetts]